MISAKIIKGDDGKLRKLIYAKEDGYMRIICSCYAKDFQDVYQIKNPTAEEIVEELR